MKVIEDLFPAAIYFVLKNEGIYSNDAYDKGGETIYGISRNMHREKFLEVYELYLGAKHFKAREIAEEFYKANYWNELYNYINMKPLAIKLFDLSVNIGKKRAVKILQRCINELGDTKIKEDGIFGPVTLRELNLIEGSKVYKLLTEKAEKYYRSLKTFWRFGRGWIRRLYDKPARW